MKTNKEKIAVMQAFEDGKKIECTVGNAWLESISPSWDWSTYDYRVATAKHGSLAE